VAAEPESDETTADESGEREETGRGSETYSAAATESGADDPDSDDGAGSSG
jgi:hypothetical protein